MSQAEQVPEDMPAYLKDEPVGTGKPLTHLFSLHSHPFQVTLLGHEPSKLGGNMDKIKMIQAASR